MAEVACFGGCLFSFDGDAGACPRCGEAAGAALAGLRLGETVCIPGLPDPSMADTVRQAQRALFMTAVSSPLAGRYAPIPGTDKGAH